MTASLEELRVDLEKERAALLAELAQMKAQPEDGMGYTNHQADDATDAFEQAADLAIRRNAERLLYQVERALQRMDAGEYGVCRNCSLPIDPARLKAIPYTRYCMDCAQRFSD